MGIFDLFRRKAAPVAGAYGGFYANPLGGDIFRKNPPPSPLDLVRENMGTANACVRLNSQLVAKTPLRLYVTTRKGQPTAKMVARGDTKRIDSKTWNHLSKSPGTGSRLRDSDEVEEVLEHPLLELLRNPGSKEDNSVGMGAFALMELTQAYQEVVGVAFWYKEKKGLGGKPSAIWPLPAQFVQQIPGLVDEPMIKEYILAVGGTKTTYSPDEIVPFRMSDIYNPYLGGFSPLRAAIEYQRLARGAVALTNSRVQNGGRPSAVWNPDTAAEGGGMIGDDVAARMRQGFRQAFAQAGNGGVLVSPYPGAVTPMSWPMNDIIDAARYELTDGQIAAAFGVPSSKLSRKDSNRASAESGDYAHGVDAGLPRCHSNADTLNRFFVTEWDDTGRLFLAYDSCVKDDATFQLEQTKVSSQLGLLTTDEGRASVGQDPLGGDAGSVRWVPNTMIPVKPDGTVDSAYLAAIAAAKPKPDAGQEDKVRKRLKAAGYNDAEIEGILTARL